MVVIGKGQALLSDGDKWYSYSGPFTADIAVPATYTLTLIPDTGLRDSFVKITPSFGATQAFGLATSLGIVIHIDGIEVFRDQPNAYGNETVQDDLVSNSIDLFIPRQSKLEIFSLNTSANNLQERGVVVLGWYL